MTAQHPGLVIFISTGACNTARRQSLRKRWGRLPPHGRDTAWPPAPSMWHDAKQIHCGPQLSMFCPCSWFQYCRSSDSPLNEQEKASVELVFVGAKGSMELEQESVRYIPVGSTHAGVKVQRHLFIAVLTRTRP